MKIAYASDNPDHLQRIGGYLRRYYDEVRIPAEICLLDGAEALLESMRETVYSLVILDMEFQDDTGVNLTYRIRSFVPHVAVMVMRHLENGKVECLFVNPTMFVMDRLTEDSFVPMFDTIRSLIYSRPQCTILISTIQNLDRILPLTELIYAESSGHRVFLHLTTGETLEIPGPIKLLADKLSGYSEFLFPHRSFIVNAFYVSCITSNALYLRTSAVTIPIARGKLNDVRLAYDAYFRVFGRDTNVQSQPDAP